MSLKYNKNIKNITFPTFLYGIECSSQYLQVAFKPKKIKTFYFNS